jgi:hypothetical protein
MEGSSSLENTATITFFPFMSIMVYKFYIIIITTVPITKKNLFGQSLPKKLISDGQIQGYSYRILKGAHNSISLWSKVISLTSNPKPGGPSLCICVLRDKAVQLHPARHRGPFALPSRTRRATVEVFQPITTPDDIISS